MHTSFWGHFVDVCYLKTKQNFLTKLLTDFTCYGVNALVEMISGLGGCLGTSYS